MDHPDHLPRLPAACYRGTAWVHWTITLHDRRTGWLDDSMHQFFRELLLHAGARYHLHCPAYCLMPDHAHVLWMGIAPHSDQLLAMRFFRRHWNSRLKPPQFKLQPQSHDRVLRQPECQQDSFEDTVLYIRQNPERAGLVKSWQDWCYGGTIVPRYPDVPIFPAAEFWGRFWKLHQGEVRRYHDSPENRRPNDGCEEKR
ncbi:hypothetical protein OKA05_21915 [Luteolibacter arcticus]|uniref:Transposase IS200-like domain-containing protein n=1 Tax=Luteolibacter arcticus TaxID=1581411 RepID=A0ABT3GP04_9BACT|nr:hypothetical protein [Luteolibacter arcticus]MCW1925232.1 hypothetical protein [Luteolibacter arcticus]